MCLGGLVQVAAVLEQRKVALAPLSIDQLERSLAQPIEVARLDG